MSKSDKTMMSDAMLDDFFAAARSEAPVPSEALLARILGDADEIGAAHEAREADALRPAARPRAARGGLLAALAAAIGGWPAMASMGTAAVAGIWIGFADPASLASVTGLLTPATSESSYEVEDLLPAYGDLSAYYEEDQG